MASLPAAGDHAASIARVDQLEAMNNDLRMHLARVQVCTCVNAN